MRYKVLLTGDNNTVIDDFFIHMDEVFESQSSSSRYEDLMSHAEYFKPDILVYCMNAENRDTISRMVPIKSEFARKDIPLAIIGDSKDCGEFRRTTAGIADLEMVKPITSRGIQEKLLAFLKVAQKRKEERRKAELALEASKREQAEKQKKADSEIDDILDSLQNEIRKKHILVVDDDIRMLKVIKEHLRSTYDVATAINGKLALKFLETKKTDLILLDYVMPDEDGPSVLKKIHENPATKDIPVVFLTGITEGDKIREALSEKPQGYLLKPIAREKLLSTIQSIIQ